MPSLLRKIGNAGVPSVGLGLMSLSAAYGQVGTDDERLEVRITFQLMLGHSI